VGSKTPETATPALDTPASGLTTPTRHSGPTLVAAKLAAPPPMDAVVRDETLEKVEAGARTRLLLVRAPAGYGKTTVVAHAAHKLGWNAVWYRLDVLDHHPAVLVASLVEGIRRRIPDFGEILTERLRDTREVALPQSEMLAIFVAELTEEVGLDLHIILDDYHEAAESAELNDALDYLLANLPSHVHLVLLTRYQPQVPLTRLKLEGLVEEITFDDLRLNGHQSATLLSRRTGHTIGDDDGDRIASLTEGWPAGICLAAHACAIAGVEPVRRALDNPRLRNDFFSYLAEEVLASEHPDTVAFLMRTCCLEAMDANLANAVADTGDAASHLDRLVAKGVFTYSNADGTYRYHHLLRDYLRQRCAQESSADELRDLTLRTARIVEERGGHAQAIELYLSANEPVEALTAVTRAGEELVENCPLDALRSWVRRLPPDVARKDPSALLLSGHVALREGRAREAIDVLSAARAASEKQRGNELLRYLLLSALETAHFWIGEFCEAEGLCEEAERYASSDTERAHVLTSLGASLGQQAEWQRGDTALDQAQRLAAGSSPKEYWRARSLMAYSQYRRGAFRTARKEFEDLLGILPGCESRSREASVVGVLSELSLDMADYAQAEMLAARVTSLCNRYGFDHFLAMGRENAARLQAAGGEPEVAVEMLQEAAGLGWVRADSWSHALILDRIAVLERRLGRPQLALDRCRQALTVLGSNVAIYPRVFIETSVACSALLLGQRDAESQLRLAQTAALDHGYPHLARRCRLLEAIIRLRAGDPIDQPTVSEDLDAMVDAGDLGFLAEELAALPTCAAEILRASGSETVLRSAVRSLAQLPRGADALACLATLDARYARIVLEPLPGRLGDAGVASILAAGSTHKCAAVRKATADVRRRCRSTHTATHPEDDWLTEREIEVLGLMARGLRNPEIATRLFLSEKTVKTHINHIFTKLEVTDRVQAVLYFKENLDV
jgi:LuxR family maltose regulon positive regulatory protein